MAGEGQPRARRARGAQPISSIKVVSVCGAGKYLNVSGCDSLASTPRTKSLGILSCRTEGSARAFCRGPLAFPSVHPRRGSSRTSWKYRRDPWPPPSRDAHPAPSRPASCTRTPPRCTPRRSRRSGGRESTVYMPAAISCDSRRGKKSVLQSMR